MDFETADTPEQRRRLEQEREDKIHAAAIRAMLCELRGLPPSSGCGVEAPRCERCVPCAEQTSKSVAEA